MCNGEKMFFCFFFLLHLVLSRTLFCPSLNAFFPWLCRYIIFIDGSGILFWILPPRCNAIWCQCCFSGAEKSASFPADPRLIGLLHSLSSPVLWLFFSAHSHLSPASLQVECEIHLFQGRSQSALCPVTDHFVCSSRQFLLSQIGIIQWYKSGG